MKPRSTSAADDLTQFHRYTDLSRPDRWKRRIRVLTAVLIIFWSHSATAGVSIWIPFDSDGGHISIPVTLNGKPTRAILDSGASGNGISERFLEQNEGDYSLGRQVVVTGIHGSRRVRPVDGIKIEMFGSAFKIDRLFPLRLYNADLIIGLSFFQLPKMTLGPFTLENVMVMVPAEGETTTVGRESLATLGSRLKKTDSDGILGYDVLKHFVVTIDFKRSLLHLAPPE